MNLKDSSDNDLLNFLIRLKRTLVKFLSSDLSMPGVVPGLGTQRDERSYGGPWLRSGLCAQAHLISPLPPVVSVPCVSVFNVAGKSYLRLH